MSQFGALRAEKLLMVLGAMVASRFGTDAVLEAPRTCRRHSRIHGTGTKNGGRVQWFRIRGRGELQDLP